MICPKCGKENEEGSRFCEDCRAVLVSPKAPEAAAPPPSTAEPPADGKWNLETEAENLYADSRQRQSAFSGEGNVHSRCPHLRVEYAMNRFLLAGAQMPLEIRITIEQREVRQVLLWFAASVGGRSELHPIPTDELAFGQAVPLVIPYYLGDTNISGMLMAKFYFGCILPDRIKFYQMDVRHTIYAKGQSAQSIIATISADGGSVVDMGNLKSLASGASNGDALLERANREPARFQVMPLKETVWRPERHFIAGKTFESASLTLEYKGRKIHICGKPTVKIGRKPELNDLVIVDWVNACRETDYPNNTISRQHAQIHFCGDSVNIIDTSSYGTFINGLKPDFAGNAGIELPDDAEIRLGDIALNMEIQRCEQKPEQPICKNCLGGKVKSMILTRQDRLPEDYLLVWQCCELGYLFRELEGVAVYRRNDGFLMRTAPGEFRHLVPGSTISFRDQTIEVKNFKQHGFNFIQQENVK